MGRRRGRPTARVQYPGAITATTHGPRDDRRRADAALRKGNASGVWGRAMNELTTTASADDLLPEIVKEHRAASEHVRHGVASAIRVGELLIQAKTLVRRGEW